MTGPDRLLRNKVFQPMADSLARATGLDCFDVARWLLCGNVATMSVFAVSRLVTRVGKPEAAGACVLAVLTAAGAAICSAAMSRSKALVLAGACPAGDHPLRRRTQVCFALAVPCWAMAVLTSVAFLPYAPAAEAPFDVIGGIGSAMAGFALMFAACLPTAVSGDPGSKSRRRPGVRPR